LGTSIVGSKHFRRFQFIKRRVRQP